MTGFVQIIEFQTSRIDEIRALVDAMPGGQGEGGGRRGTVTADRDRPGFYLTIIEFDSYESAMSNSARASVSEFAGRMAALCDGPPRFYNLDVVESWDSGTSPSTKAALVGAATAVAGAAAAGLAKARELVQERRQHTTAATTPPAPATTTPVPPPAPPVDPDPMNSSDPMSDPPPAPTL